MTLPSGPLVFEARTVIVCLIVGVGVTIVSAISPARRAVRIAPVAAVSEQQTEQEVPMRRRFTRGGVITVIGVVAARRRAVTSRPSSSWASARS